jgi:hypothetical protein
MLSFLPKFTLVQFPPYFLEIFGLGISEMLHCSMSAPQVKFTPLLDVHQLLMLFEEMLRHSESGKFSTVFYNTLQ